MIFVKIFLADVRRTEVPGHAFNLTGLMEWPDDPEDDTLSKLRFERIADEIVRRTLDEIEKPLRDAFVRIAATVIERERRERR